MSQMPCVRSSKTLDVIYTMRFYKKTLVLCVVAVVGIGILTFDSKLFCYVGYTYLFWNISTNFVA